MSKSRRRENNESVMSKVATGSKRVVLSIENRRARKAKAATWKRQWNEELLSDVV